MAFFLASRLRKKRLKTYDKGLPKDFLTVPNYNRDEDMDSSLQKCSQFDMSKVSKHTSDSRKIPKFQPFGSLITTYQIPRAHVVIPEARMDTFVQNGWSSSRFSSAILAAAGFVYRGNGTEIHCHNCNIKTDVSTWSDNDKPTLVHARLANNCQFVIDNGYNMDFKQQSLKQLTREGDNHFDLMSQCFNELNLDKKVSDIKPSTADYQNEYTRKTLVPDAMTSQITQDGFQSYHPQFQSQDARDRSYANWRFGHNQTPRSLTEAGYFYTGKQYSQLYLIIVLQTIWQIYYNAKFKSGNFLCLANHS